MLVRQDDLAVLSQLRGCGANYPELCAVLRELARSCKSTAMALAIRTHLLAATVWCTGRATRLRGCLRCLADQQLVLVSTGASDWLDSSGTAEPVQRRLPRHRAEYIGSGSPS
jgi:hypothetical protein